MRHQSPGSPVKSQKRHFTRIPRPIARLHQQTIATKGHHQSPGRYNNSKPVLYRRKSPALVPASAVSCPRQVLGIPGNKIPKDIRSQPNIRLRQLHGNDANVDKLKNHVQKELLVRQTMGNTTKCILPQQDSHIHKNDRDIDNSKHSAQPQSVPDLNSRLTIEGIYIEAMTLAAEIRIRRRQLCDKEMAKLTRILEFCHRALREKLVLRSITKRARVPSGRNNQKLESDARQIRNGLVKTS